MVRALIAGACSPMLPEHSTLRLLQKRPVSKRCVCAVVPAVDLATIFEKARTDEFGLLRDMRSGRFKRLRRFWLVGFFFPFAPEDDSRVARLLNHFDRLLVRCCLDTERVVDYELSSAPRNSLKLSDSFKQQRLTSPWVPKHAKMLESICPGFQRYSRSARSARMFDLVAWAVCQGAFELAYRLLQFTASPLRATLLVHEMCSQLTARQRVNASDVEDVQWMQDRCLALATGVLDALPEDDIELRAVLMSTAGSTHYGQLGSYSTRKGKPFTVLELATTLGNKRFVAHRHCIKLFDDAWLGRTPMGSLARLRRQPSMRRIFLQIICPFVRVLPLLPNDLHPDIGSQKFKRHCTHCSRSETHMFDFARTKSEQLLTVECSNPNCRKPVDLHLSVYDYYAHFWRIPLVKEKLQLVSCVLFYLLFVGVCLQPLRGPILKVEWVFFFWLMSLNVQELQQAIRLGGLTWIDDLYNRADLFLLILYHVAVALRVYLAYDIYYLDGSEFGLEDGLRAILAFLLVVAPFRPLFEFAMHRGVGLHLLALRKMFLDVVSLCVPLLLILIGFGFAYTLLVPNYELAEFYRPIPPDTPNYLPRLNLNPTVRTISSDRPQPCPYMPSPVFIPTCSLKLHRIMTHHALHAISD